jgi:hypothetical protein
MSMSHGPSRKYLAEGNYQRVYLRFALRGASWRCEFVPDGTGPLPRVLTFSSADKVRELAQRGDGLPNLEAKQALELGLRAGRGGTYLRLSPEQIAKLR